MENTKTGCKSEQYVVGGAVRDVLLGAVPKDIDYVWVNSSEEELTRLGMKQVGIDFPVFLDNRGNEHALARTERKTGTGYQGFECNVENVTLFDDLKRRDLTCNSLAVKVSDWDAFLKSSGTTGEVFDYFGGQEDLKNKVLRHTSEAFKEDPVRILRVARLAARYGFVVAGETYDLMTEMVNNGEFDSLVAERVWSELERALMEKCYWKVWFVLDKCGALNKLNFFKRSNYDSFEAAADAGESLLFRCAAAFQFECEDAFRKNRIPSEIAELAMTSDKIQTFCQEMSFDTTRRDILKMFMSVDLFRRSERFEAALKVLKLRDVKVAEIIVDWAKKVQTVDCGAIALACEDKKQIPDMIAAARIAAMNFDSM
jgi:tRNA nucleotidyltransferase (CCA-adding enzyme)